MDMVLYKRATEKPHTYFVSVGDKVFGVLYLFRPDESWRTDEAGGGFPDCGTFVAANVLKLLECEEASWLEFLVATGISKEKMEECLRFILGEGDDKQGT